MSEVSDYTQPEAHCRLLHSLPCALYTTSQPAMLRHLPQTPALCMLPLCRADGLLGAAPGRLQLQPHRRSTAGPDITLSGGSGRLHHDSCAAASSGGTPAGPAGQSAPGSPSAGQWPSNLAAGSGPSMLASQQLTGSKESLVSAATGLASGLPLGAAAPEASRQLAAELPLIQLPVPTRHAAGSLPVTLSAGADQLAAALGLGGEQPPAPERWDSLLLDLNGEFSVGSDGFVGRSKHVG